MKPVTGRPSPIRIVAFVSSLLWGLLAGLPPLASAQDRPRDAFATRTPTVTLAQALEAAWQRSVTASEMRALQGQAQAQRALSDSWIAATPAVSVGQREKPATTAASGRETELGLALPLWLPGQRVADGHAAQAQTEWLVADEAVERLRLAGQLREAAGAIQLAAAELQQSTRQAESLRQLVEDVRRRVEAGDLAPADLLASRSEWLAARSQTSLAQQALDQQQTRWRLLTGLPPVELRVTVMPAPQSLPDSHPELVLARAGVNLGQRRTELARIQRLEQPELALGMRHERSAQPTDAQTSLVATIRFPVGGQRYQAPRLAAALGELDIAHTRAERTRERLAAELDLAHSLAKLSLDQWQTDRERTRLLAERARLIELSFRAGETGLPDMLRALAAAAQAESAAARQEVTHQMSIARLQQALGVLP